MNKKQFYDFETNGQKKANAKVTISNVMARKKANAKFCTVDQNLAFDFSGLVYLAVMYLTMWFQSYISRFDRLSDHKKTIAASAIFTA